MSGHCTTEGTAAKHKICSEGEFEGPRKRQKISLSWDMEGNDTDRREVMKELNCQLALHSDVHGCHFEGTLSEGGSVGEPKKTEATTAPHEYKMQGQQDDRISHCKSEITEQGGSCQMKGLPEECGHTKDRKSTSRHIHEGGERSYKAAERRSRKGIPYRRFRGDSTKYIGERDGMPVEEDAEVRGILNKRSLNSNRHHDWLEYRNRMMTMSEPERKRFQVPQEDNAQYHCWKDVQDSIPQLPWNLGKERMIPGNNCSTYGGNLLYSEQFNFAREFEKQRNERKQNSLGRHLTSNQIVKKSGMKFGDPRLGGNATGSFQGETASFIMHHSRANEVARRAPFYSPGRFKQMNSKEMLWHQKPTRTVSDALLQLTFLIPNYNLHVETETKETTVVRKML